MKAEFLPTDTRFSVVVETHRLKPVLLRTSSICSTDSVHAGSDLVRLEAIKSQDGTSQHLRVHAGNGSVFLDAVLKVQSVDVEGEIHIPADRLVSVLKQASGSTVSISCVGFEVQVSSGNSMWRLKTPAKASIPTRPDIEGETYRIQAKELHLGLHSTIKAVASGLARASMAQVRFNDNYVIACDGTRLHKKEIPGMQLSESFEIPTYVAKLFMDAVNDVADDVVIRVGQFTVSVVTGTEMVTTLRSKLKYPDVERLFLTQAVMNDSSVQFIRNELLDAVKIVKTFADEVLSCVHIKSSADGQIIIQSEDEIGNAAQSRIKANTTSSSVIDLRLNYRHLMDALVATGSEILEMRVSKNSKTTKSSAFIADSEINFQAILGQVNLG